MRAKLINVGRSKVCREINVSDEHPLQDALVQASQHLLSADVDLWLKNGSKVSYEVIVGGFRPVGQVEFEREVIPSPF